MSDPDTERESIAEPLQLDRIFLQKIWGGRVLEETPGIEIEPEGPIGETWELVDREDRVSVIRGGSFGGRSLRGLMMSSADAILGETSATESGHFPLMIKYLCATKPLSVQVHPDDKAAQRLGVGDEGKHECWYVLAAEPESLIYLGLKEGVDASEFVDVAGTSAIVDHLQPFEVRTGDFINVPAGTLHSIGEGITLVEVQNNADVTFRLYDWDRTGLNGEPRELHKEQALVSVDWEARLEGPTRPNFESCGGGNQRAHLIEAEQFSVTLYELASFEDFDACDRAAAYVLIEGRARIAKGEERWSMEGGDTWLLPASLGAHRVMPEGEQAKVLRVETRG
ncbi:MAG: class I mannose-6-phosphate isomerase [Planctomycetes bacterium]|nr:class I mannose-6-phosphate isomerase [Planctomycetota bacterium]